MKGVQGLGGRFGAKQRLKNLSKKVLGQENLLKVSMLKGGAGLGQRAVGLATSGPWLALFIFVQIGKR